MTPGRIEAKFKLKNTILGGFPETEELLEKNWWPRRLARYAMAKKIVYKNK